MPNSSYSPPPPNQKDFEELAKAFRNLPKPNDNETKQLRKEVNILTRSIHGLTAGLARTGSMVGKGFRSVTAPVGQVAREINEDVRVDKSQTIGMLASRINPLVGYAVEKALNTWGDSIKSGMKRMGSAAWMKVKDGYSNIREKRQESATSGTYTRVNQGHQNRMYRSSKSVLDAIDRLRISNVQTLREMSGGESFKIKKLKEVPKARVGGYVRKSGQAVIHEGEIISPSHMIEAQTDYLFRIAKAVERMAGTDTSSKHSKYSIGGMNDASSMKSLFMDIKKQNQAQFKLNERLSLGFVSRKSFGQLSIPRKFIRGFTRRYDSFSGTEQGQMLSSLQEIRDTLKGRTNVGVLGRLNETIDKVLLKFPFLEGAWRLTRFLVKDVVKTIQRWTMFGGRTINSLVETFSRKRFSFTGLFTSEARRNLPKSGTPDEMTAKTAALIYEELFVQNRLHSRQLNELIKLQGGKELEEKGRKGRIQEWLSNWSNKNIIGKKRWAQLEESKQGTNQVVELLKQYVSDNRSIELDKYRNALLQQIVTNTQNLSSSNSSSGKDDPPPTSKRGQLIQMFPTNSNNDDNLPPSSMRQRNRPNGGFIISDFFSSLLRNRNNNLPVPLGGASSNLPQNNPLSSPNIKINPVLKMLGKMHGIEQQQLQQMKEEWIRDDEKRKIEEIEREKRRKMDSFKDRYMGSGGTGRGIRDLAKSQLPWMIPAVSSIVAAVFASKVMGPGAGEKINNGANGLWDKLEEKTSKDGIPATQNVVALLRTLAIPLQKGFASSMQNFQNGEYVTGGLKVGGGLLASRWLAKKALKGLLNSRTLAAKGLRKIGMSGLGRMIKPSISGAKGIPALINSFLRGAKIVRPQAGVLMKSGLAKTLAPLSLAMDAYSLAKTSLSKKAANEHLDYLTDPKSNLLGKALSSGSNIGVVLNQSHTSSVFNSERNDYLRENNALIDLIEQSRKKKDHSYHIINSFPGLSTNQRKKYLDIYNESLKISDSSLWKTLGGPKYSGLDRNNIIKRIQTFLVMKQIQSLPKNDSSIIKIQDILSKYSSYSKSTMLGNPDLSYISSKDVYESINGKNAEFINPVYADVKKRTTAISQSDKTQDVINKAKDVKNNISSTASKAFSNIISQISSFGNWSTQNFPEYDKVKSKLSQSTIKFHDEVPVRMKEYTSLVQKAIQDNTPVAIEKAKKYGDNLKMFLRIANEEYIKDLKKYLEGGSSKIRESVSPTTSAKEIQSGIAQKEASSQAVSVTEHAKLRSTLEDSAKKQTSDIANAIVHTTNSSKSNSIINNYNNSPKDVLFWHDINSVTVGMV